MAGSYALIYIPLMLHFIIAFSAFLKINHCSILTTKHRVSLQLITWLVPIVGTVYVHMKVENEYSSIGSGSDIDSSVGDGGGGGCGGGDCG